MRDRHGAAALRRPALRCRCRGAAMLRPGAPDDHHMTLTRRRNSLRLRGYDYRTPGAYFVTICTEGRRPVLLGAQVHGTVEACWAAIPSHFPHVQLDAFVVMPNHIHGILHLLDHGPDGTPIPGRVLPGSLSAVVRSFKAASARQLRAQASLSMSIWQRHYYDRIVTDHRDLDLVREYIANNPANWRYDPENPERDESAEYLKAWSWVERPQGAAVLRPYVGQRERKRRRRALIERWVPGREEK
ncbi:MAG TPA: transposase [Dehalococcoidia bacterium]|nr:transposase [Dehalococcoidia bacterium]